MRHLRYFPVLHDALIIQIFTESRSEENALPSAQILTHVKQLAPQEVVPFLEHIINKRKETAAEFHNELVFNYLDTILALKKDSPMQSKGRMQAGTEPGLLGTTRKKLLLFLEESKYYAPEKILTKCPYDGTLYPTAINIVDLYEERALLMSRLGEHEEALSIYAHKLKDVDMAEKYVITDANVF